MLSLPQHHYTESLFLQASWRQGVMVITSGTHGVEGFPAAQCLLSFPFCVSRVSSVFFNGMASHATRPSNERETGIEK